MSIRPAACVLAAATLCACAAQRPAPTSAPATAVVAKPGAVGPLNAPVPAPGRPAPIALDASQRAELDRAVASRPLAERARLRYALALAEGGGSKLVVYDGQGLDANARRRGKANAYVVFLVLNSTLGEHYDPQQNALIAPIPPAPQRDSVLTP